MGARRDESVVQDHGPADPSVAAGVSRPRAGEVTSAMAIETTRAPRAVDRLAMLREHSLFGALGPEVIERLGSYMTTRTVRRGATIFAKGDPGTGLMGVLSGTVKISVLSADGREAVLNLIRQGEVFGEIALLDGRPRTADAIAMTDCELVVI